ncbi:NUDIX hydrolase [Sutcliffiella horikoshii]|uniref:NUDIX hydrolase n=1 Tax=Sutcliffiella horikoshii TaxID=79883 RepID=UPI001F262FBA|nr:NUDIX domain-containing protein [Sutcliffiella horikoshii]MCG1022944.1 NUDIX domain-containing protein [Sutcliffiella horikoshii]
MYFNRFIGIEKEENKHIKVRKAVRAIVIRDGHILMVHSNKGDFKFPGGGVEQEETHREALIREVLEETGYADTLVGEKFGVFVETREDIFNHDVLFEMNSHYYLCECRGEKVAQQLEGYEIEQGFTPKWILIEEAISQNELAQKLSGHNGWIERETYVLRMILQYTKDNLERMIQP